MGPNTIVAMRIELFGVARARAGVAELEVEAETLADALRALAARCPGVVPDVVDRTDGTLAPAFLVSLNGERFVREPQTPLAKGDTLLLLGAQMGG